MLLKRHTKSLVRAILIVLLLLFAASAFLWLPNNTTNGYQEQRVDALSPSRAAFPFVILLSGIGGILSLFSLLLMWRGDSRGEVVSPANDDRLQAIHEIIFQRGVTIEHKMRTLLECSCKMLGMDTVLVERLNPGGKSTTVMTIITPYNNTVQKGIVLPVEKTLCHTTLSSQCPLVINNIAASEYKNHPLVGLLGIQCYIGTGVRVQQQDFGIISFSKRKPIKFNVSESDFTLIKFVAAWIGMAMENQLKEQSLETAAANAEASNRAKSAFLASMSHEIRTPLTAILGYSDMLRDTDQSAEDVAHEIDSIIRSGMHLQRIINDILDLSKIEAGQLSVEHMDVEFISLIVDMESMFADRARKQGITFDVEYDFPIPMEIVTDPTRLKQILFNLCSNAVKFTESGGVKVKIRFVKSKQQLIFSISDTGIGMDEREISRLFKPFSQANTSTTRKFGGTGLGLCIAKQLAKNLGGDVVVNSVKGQGSTFEVSTAVGDTIATRWFYSRAEMFDEGVTENTGKSLFSIAGHVLLVEANANIKTLINNCLHNAGATVDVVGDGLSAVQQAMSRDYDVVLTATKLPALNGLQLTKTLRSQGYNKPIIGMFLHNEPSELKKYVSAGANDCIMQPIDIQQFYTVLSKYLKSTHNPHLGVAV
ncbi:MAG: response regulator [Gammaproteobacteria bacterium]|nr:response regulator [Gammaproteobacteria bacterium]